MARVAVRAGAVIVLVAMLIGVPIVAVVTLDPFGGGVDWSGVWTTGRISDEMVVVVGLGLFVALWLWFALTAVVEVVRVLRRVPSAPGDASGPGGMVRTLVRLALLSSAGVSLFAVANGVTTNAADRSLAAHVAPFGALPPDGVTEVSAGAELVSASSSTNSPTAGLGAAVLLSAGVLGVVEVRRRRRLRSSDVGDRWPPPSPAAARAEALLRRMGAGERIARLDVALRSVARDLAAQRARVVAAWLGDDGAVRVYPSSPAVPAAGPWTLDLFGEHWNLDAFVSLEELAPLARQSAPPCPALAHVGGLEGGGELFIDLEAVGMLVVDSPHADAIVRALAVSMATSPLLDSGRLFVAGVDLPTSDRRDVDHVGGVECRDLVAALALARDETSWAMSLGRDDTTFELRARGMSGEAWEPAVVIGSVDAALPECDVRPWRGVGVAVAGPVSGVHRLAFEGSCHVYEPLGLRVLPIGLDRLRTESVRALLTEADAPLPFAPPIAGATFVEPDWALMVRVLGQVEVVSCDGEPVQFERSKALELAVWLSQHRDRPTRTAARTALWDLDVRPATFANVVSDARRAMARAVPPPHGEEWIARTLTEELPLHASVVTDAELLAERVAAARSLPPRRAIAVLRPGLELVTGLPFTGTGYLWTDAEGHTSSLVLLATGAAIELACHYLADGDVDGVFWATGQGLKVLAGHEELIALRMRAHAQRGDLAGVRHEWESYERALAADPWCSDEPAPKLVALRRELLGPSVRTTA